MSISIGFNFGQNKSSSKPVIEEAALTPAQRANLFNVIGGQAGFSFSPRGEIQQRDVTQQFAGIPLDKVNQYQAMIQSALSNPYQPTSAENQLLENIMGQTSAQFARRGLGSSPIAASSVAGSIAPSLIAMRQAQLANLFQGLGGELQAGQNLLTQRGQDINALLGQRGQQLEGLLNFLQQVGFKRNLGQISKGSGFNFGISGGGGGGGSQGVTT